MYIVKYLYAKGEYSFHRFHSSVRPTICQLTPAIIKLLFRSFLITYISAATYQKLFLFGMGVPGRVLFHSACVDLWVMPRDRARGQNLGHLNKVVFAICLYKQLLNKKDGWASVMFITSTFSVIRSRSL